MNEISHYIITRFFDRPLGKFKDEDLLSSKMLDMGIDLLNANLLKSLENQSCNQFALILMIHDNLAKKNPNIFEKLEQIKKQHSFSIKLACKNQLNDFIAISSGCTKRVISRVDYDDLLLNAVIEDTQEFARKHQKNVVSIYGYNNGWTWRDDNHWLYETDKKYGFAGHFSALQSVILDVCKARTLNQDKFDVLSKLMPYIWDHSSCMSYVKKLPSNIQQYIEMKYNLNLRAYVWMRHANTGSIDPYNLKADKMSQVKDKKLIDALDFETQFGRRLDIRT